MLQNLIASRFQKLEILVAWDFMDRLPERSVLVVVLFCPDALRFRAFQTDILTYYFRGMTTESSTQTHTTAVQTWHSLPHTIPQSRMVFGVQELTLRVTESY